MLSMKERQLRRSRAERKEQEKKKKYGKRMKTIWHDQMGQSFFLKRAQKTV